MVEGECEEELRRVENVEVGSGRITMTEVEDVTIKKTKKEKAAGSDGIMGEMIRAGGGVLCMAGDIDECRLGEWGSAKDWQEACVVPVYKGRGYKSECGIYRGIRMMSVVGKLYGKVVIDRVKNITDGLVGEEQGVLERVEGVWIRCLL